jgi:phosphinothricin acetyltransferase
MKAATAVDVRLASPERDAAAVAAIYAPVVEGTVISFEERPPDAGEMAERMQRTLASLPWLVAEEAGAVIGYAYAAPHRERAAYRWSVDVSAYVAAGMRGRGVGRRLYDDLLARLRTQRLVNAFAGITLPNPASVALHEAIGMRLVGVYPRVGYKLGNWHDVAWYGMRLAEPEEPDGPPPEPIRLPDLSVDGSTPSA